MSAGYEPKHAGRAVIGRIGRIGAWLPGSNRSEYAALSTAELEALRARYERLRLPRLLAEVRAELARRGN